jgi:hypothetical protein
MNSLNEGDANAISGDNISDLPIYTYIHTYIHTHTHTHIHTHTHLPAQGAQKLVGQHEHQDISINCSIADVRNSLDIGRQLDS